MPFIKGCLALLTNDEIKEYIIDFVNIHKAVNQVWLIGSRVHGKIKRDSDWDLLVSVHDGGKTLQLSRKNVRLKSEAERLNVDLFIQEDNKIFINPWRSKKLDLGSNDMNFQQFSPEPPHQRWVVGPF